MSLIENAFWRKSVRIKFNYILSNMFVEADEGRVRVRQAQIILLYFAGLPSNINNLRLAAEFLLDKNYIMRYNKGYRYYKGISANLGDEQLFIINRDQKLRK